MLIIRVGLASDKAFAASTQQQSIHISGLSQGIGGSRSFALPHMHRADEHEIKAITIGITPSRETDADELSVRDPMASELDYRQAA